jgi:hypothetical protein
MKISRSIYRIFFLLLGTCISFSYTRSVKRFEEPYIVSIDCLLSDHEQEKVITAFVKERSASTPTLFEKLLHQFPEIKTISMVHHPAGVNKLFISAHAPQARINKELVLNEAGEFAPTKIYEQAYVQQLINVSIPHLPLVPARDLTHFIQSIPQSLYEQFTVSWMRPTEVWLQGTTHSDFLIACDDRYIPDTQSVSQCEHIYQLMKESHKRAKKPTSIITDVRFENQIIAYFKEGV